MYKTILGAMPVINNFATYHSHPSFFLLLGLATNAEDREVNDCPNIIKLAIDQSLAKMISSHFRSIDLTRMRIEKGNNMNRYDAMSDFR